MSDIGELVAGIKQEVECSDALYCTQICDVRSVAGAKAIQWYLIIESDAYKSVPLQLGAAGASSDEFSRYIGHQVGLWLLHLINGSRKVYFAKGIQTDDEVVELPRELMTKESAQRLINPLAPKVIEIGRQFP